MSVEMKPMNCMQFEEIVHDLDRPGTHGLALRERALAHAESCGRCGQLLTETESLDQALHAIATTEGEQGAPAWMESELLREFRYAKDGTRESISGRRAAALGIAAVLLLAAGLSLHRYVPGVKGRAPGQPIQANGSAAATAGPSTASAVESAADFIALPYADDPDGVEGGTVVRVELSGPALASLGMPVSLAGSSGSIAADLLVSDDGTPQAIRLVSQDEWAQEF
ncbi:MAG TPA: hypothetical protein VMD77_04270 [Candidatus Baltobacteraceae bacterium]|jgi:hypothetical protein|nr:hypothetical protein [Candidatus Baltobacteraceae bacterium]